MKLKHVFFLLYSLFTNTFVCSQTITDFFQELPDSSIMGLTKKERAKIVKYSLDNISYDDALKDIQKEGNSYALSKVDLKNGFLEMVGYFEGFLQMSYWKLSNGSKLIAVYQCGSGPIGYVELFDFYIFNEKKYELVKFNDIIPINLEKDFFSKNYEENMKRMEKEDVVTSLLFELPRRGKNIIVKFGNEESKKTYQKYNIIGNRMTLIWDDGKFIKGNIYWEN
jgi:hypothetical protein